MVMTRDRNSARGASYQAMAVAWNMGWPIAAGLLLGVYLDKRWDSSPFAALFCSLAALAAVVKRLISLTAASGKDSIDGGEGKGQGSKSSRGSG